MWMSCFTWNCEFPVLLCIVLWFTEWHLLVFFSILFFPFLGSLRFRSLPGSHELPRRNKTLILRVWFWVIFFLENYYYFLLGLIMCEFILAVQVELDIPEDDRTLVTYNGFRVHTTSWCTWSNGGFRYHPKVIGLDSA